MKFQIQELLILQAMVVVDAHSGSVKAYVGTSFGDPVPMFIPDPNFFHPGSEFFPSRI